MDRIIEEIIKMVERNDEKGIQQLIDHFEEGMMLSLTIDEYNTNKIMKNMCINELKLIRRKCND